jgi:hypothetical protein
VIERAPVPTKEVDPKVERYTATFKAINATDPKGKKLAPDEVVKRVTDSCAGN